GRFGALSRPQSARVTACVQCPQAVTMGTLQRNATAKLPFLRPARLRKAPGRAASPPPMSTEEADAHGCRSLYSAACRWPQQLMAQAVEAVWLVGAPQRGRPSDMTPQTSPPR